MEIVGEYRGKPNPDTYANFLQEVGKEYGECMIVVENNSIGYAVLQKLMENEYPNIYFSTKSSHDYVDQIEAESKSNAIAGFTMSTKTRPLVIAKMEEFMRNKLVTLDKDTTAMPIITEVSDNNWGEIVTPKRF